jgi:hypothetical protein
MNSDEQAQQLRLKRKAMYEADFLPDYTPGRIPNPDGRIANAAEYSAYQLGQINRNLAKLVSLLEKKG